MPQFYFIPWLSIDETPTNGSINTGQDIANPFANDTFLTTPNTLLLSGPTTTIDLEDSTDDILQDEFNIGNQTLTSPYTDPNDPLNVNPIGTGVETLYHYTIRDLSDPTAPEITIYGIAIDTNPLVDELDGFLATQPLVPGVQYTVVGTSSISNPSYASLVPCFTAGTEVETPLGAREISTLHPGDFVLTKDRGAQPVRWIGKSTIHFSDDDNDHLRPIVLRPGALGRNIPDRELRLSPQHRVLVTSRIAERMFNTQQVLVAVKQLLELQGVEVDKDCSVVTYFHVLFEHHEILKSHGLESESLYLGPQAIKAISSEGRREIAALFPNLTFPISPARTLVQGRRARRLASRHRLNDQAIVQPAVH